MKNDLSMLNLNRQKKKHLKAHKPREPDKCEMIGRDGGEERMCAVGEQRACCAAH